MKNKCLTPIAENLEKFSVVKTALKETYLKVQAEYLQYKINTIKDSATNNKSATAWKTVNEISRRKNTQQSKVKAKSQEEHLHLCKKYFQDLLGKPPIISEKAMTPVISQKLKIRKGAFASEELQDAIKNGKACGLDNIPAEVWKLGEFNDILLNFCNSVYQGNPIERWEMGCLLPLSKKGDLGYTKNYHGTTLSCIAVKIYNLMLLNRIRLEMDKILHKNQNGFRPNRSTSGQIMTIQWI